MKPDERPTLARRLERAWPLNLTMVVSGVAALGITWAKSGFNLDINSVIFLFFLAGLLLHWRPIAYVEAVNNAARVTGPLILQYPLYGGIMGVMTATGLADVISKAFIAFSNAHTLPFWNFVASMIISLLSQAEGDIGRCKAHLQCRRPRSFMSPRRRPQWRLPWVSKSPT